MQPVFVLCVSRIDWLCIQGPFGWLRFSHQVDRDNTQWVEFFHPLTWSPDPVYISRAFSHSSCRLCAKSFRPEEQDIKPFITTPDVPATMSLSTTNRGRRAEKLRESVSVSAIPVALFFQCRYIVINDMLVHSAQTGGSKECLLWQIPCCTPCYLLQADGTL
jgi:hypothetical protein